MTDSRTVGNRCTAEPNRESSTVLRQGEIKSGSFAGRAAGPDLAAVPVDNLLDGGQADARSGKVNGVVQPLERRKEFAGSFHLKAGSIV